MSLKIKHQDTIASIGDTIRVHQEIVEGSSKRIQVFEGIIIAVKNRGQNKTFTVRKIGTNNVGVEKIFPVFMPSIKKIEVKRKGKVRRSKLYYLREKQGKAASRVKERKEFEQKPEPAKPEKKEAKEKLTPVSSEKKELKQKSTPANIKNKEAKEKPATANSEKNGTKKSK